jgi:hypothetical protein
MIHNLALQVVDMCSTEPIIAMRLMVAVESGVVANNIVGIR